MRLRLYNTLTHQEEEFKPLDDTNVRMYVCGPTVYDYAHVGNARPIVVFDVLYRLLRNIYGKTSVKYVRNITDVDDKIIERHLTSGRSITAITRETTRAFHEDIAALGVLKPNVEPRATKHIPEMKEMIRTLIEKDHAYVANGHVLFRVSSMQNYGQLSRKNLEELIEGARVEIAPFKENPADFVLWKPSSSKQPGWESMWGRGRPGWHIECSAMSSKHLGVEFDIHGGGIDLTFPHHENEIAQSTCAYEHSNFARVWMHNGFVSVEGQKMSKSLGNFITIRDALKRYHGETIRLAMLMTLYRKPLDWTASRLNEARETLDTWYGALRKVRHIPTENQKYRSLGTEWSLNDDLNTPEAIAGLNLEIGNLNLAIMYGRDHQIPHLKSVIMQQAELLGLLQHEPDDWFKDRRRSSVLEVEAAAASTPFGNVQLLSDEAIEDAIQRRLDARRAKNFSEADRIREELKEIGVVLDDTKDGTVWRRG